MSLKTVSSAWHCVHAAMVLALLVFASPVSAQTLKTLYDFAGSTDGAQPMGPLIADSSGALYGTASAGGTYGYGTVFKLTPPAKGNGAWSFTVLWSFDGATGATPATNLLMDATGALYGVVGGGGTGYIGGNTGNGVVFKLTHPLIGRGAWTYTVLWGFGGTADGDGSLPVGGLISDPSGALYGVTIDGGTANYGTVFKLTPPASRNGHWTESVLWSASRADGAPDGLLYRNSAGTLFGGTAGGGAIGDGSVFMLTQPSKGHSAWTETQIFSSTSYQTGEGFHGPLMPGKNGTLYGLTSGAGPGQVGTFYELTPPATQNGSWTYSLQHSFDETTEGGFPYAGLVADASGNFYGANSGGGSTGWGTIFKLTPPQTNGRPWPVSVLWTFGETDGYYPQAALTLGKGGAIYGTTRFGGTSRSGTVFQITP